MSAPEKSPGPSFRLNPKATGFARNRSHTMGEVMWEDASEAAAKEGVKYGEFARRAVSAYLHRLGFRGYSEDGRTYPADRRPEPE